MTYEILLAGGSAIAGAVATGLVAFYNAKQKDKRVDFDTLLVALRTENENLKQEVSKLHIEISKLQRTVIDLERRLMERDIKIQQLEKKLDKDG